MKVFAMTPYWPRSNSKGTKVEVVDVGFELIVKK